MNTYQVNTKYTRFSYPIRYLIKQENLEYLGNTKEFQSDGLLDNGLEKHCLPQI